MKQSRHISAFALFLLLSSQAAFAKEGGIMDFFNKKEKAPAPAAAATASATASTSVAAAVDPSAGNLDALVMRMANNKTMTDAEKRSLAQTGLSHFPQGADVRSASYEKQVLLFEQIVNDPNMKVAEKKTALDSQMTGAAESEVAADETAQTPADPALKEAAEEEADIEALSSE